ncbi:MAG: GTP pyrophosphokinase [Chitinophagales bacterium]|nr:GTP pyrophosphokinase [Chitinophagales bacterium]
MQKHFEKAMSIAIKAHEGQKDKAGAPYLLHVLRVMMSVEKMDEKIVSLLHDVVEDSEMTLVGLAKEGFPKKILKAVELLTKTESKPYKDYIQEIKNNDLARVVKLADLKDNMNITRLKKVTESDKLRIKKYKAAYNLLNSQS